MPTPFLFLKLMVGGARVDGESSEKHFERQIEIEGLDWEMESSHEPVDDGRNTRKVKTTNRPKRVTLRKAFDRSTTNLCTFMDARKPFSEAVITMVKGVAWGDKPRIRVEIILTKGYVESVNLTASESGLAVAVKESFTLSFESLKIVYRPDVPSGGGSEAPATTFQLELPSEA